MSLRTDVPAQRALLLHPGRRAHRHHRGRRRAAAAAGARGPPGVAAAQHRGPGSGHHPRPGAQLAAHAARPDRGGRVPWRREPRHAAGDEHGARRVAVDGARQLAPRRDRPAGDARPNGRHGPAAAGDPRADRLGGRRRRAADAAARRHPAGHPRHRGAGHGGGDGDPAGRLPVRLLRRRGRLRPVPRQARADRRPAALHRPLHRDGDRLVAAGVRRAGTRADPELGLMPALLVVGLAAVLAALLLLTLVVLTAPARVPLSRLDPAVAPPSSVLAGAGAAAGAVVQRALERRGGVGAGEGGPARAGVRMSLPDFVLVTALATLGACVLGVLLGGPWPALLLAVLVPLGAKVLLSFRAGRRQARIADQLGDALQLMSSSLRAGHSLLRAVDSVAQEAAAPMSEEFTRLVVETRVGRDLDDALAELSARMGSDDFTWIAQAIAIHREVGGNLAEVLDAVGHTIRERNAIRRQVKALSAEGKLSAIVLMALPFGVTAFISMSNPSYIAKFTESLMGYAMLAVAVVMLLVGGLWLKSTVKIKF